MNEREKKISFYCDGIRTSKEIAVLCQDNCKYVQSTALKYSLPRRGRGSSFGKMNGSWKGGKAIDHDGYILVSVSGDHPYCRIRNDRKTGRILEHRLMMEKKIGRYLLSSEVVDHIDGLTLHNEPDNLRLFSSNKEHLSSTLAGLSPQWSLEGKINATKGSSSLIHKPVDTHHQRRVLGEVRLHAILRYCLVLNYTDKYVPLYMHHHLLEAGVSSFSYSNLEFEFLWLCSEWGVNPSQYI